MKCLKSTSLIQNGIKPYVIGKIHSYISIMTGYPYKGINDIEFSTDIIYSDYSIRRVVCHFRMMRIPVYFRHLIDRIQYGNNAEYVNVTCMLTPDAIPMMTIKIKEYAYALARKNITDSLMDYAGYTKDTLAEYHHYLDDNDIED